MVDFVHPLSAIIRPGTWRVGDARRKTVGKPLIWGRHAIEGSTESAVAQLKYLLQQAFERSQAPLSFAPDPASMGRFLDACHRRRYPGKTAIIRPGDPANTLYYVVEGSLAVCTEDEEGRERHGLRGRPNLLD